MTRIPLVHDLDLSDSLEITEVSIQAIANNLIFLKHLALSRCFAIKACGFTFLTKAKSLRFMELFGLMKPPALKRLSHLIPGIQVNRFPLSPIARPTTGPKRRSIWDQMVRD